MKKSEFKKMAEYVNRHGKRFGLKTSEIAMERIAKLADPLNTESFFLGSIINPISEDRIFDSYDNFVKACHDAFIKLKFLKLTNVPTLIINAGIGDDFMGFTGYFNLSTGDEIIESCQSGEFEVYGTFDRISKAAKKIDFIYNLKFRV